MNHNRRKLIKLALAMPLSIPLTGEDYFLKSLYPESEIKIALQCVSLANKIFSGKMSILDFPRLVREDFNIEAAEYWNLPLIEKRKDPNFIKEIINKTNDYGLQNTIMLVDLYDLQTKKTKSICDSDKKIRVQAIEEYKEWIDIAKKIGCNSIRVGLWSKGMNSEEVNKISKEGLNKLLEYSSTINISIVIENHGGFSADGSWLVNLIKSINHPQLGTLPDFGTSNFCIERSQLSQNVFDYSGKCINQYDKYKGVEQMLPFAKGISAKSINFDKNGEEVNTDFGRMISLIKSYNFKGFMSIEYEGAFSGYLDNHDGILATKKLIEKYL
ncbi:MAG: sugar phosphate isomerase/epimerase family protein [Flavobacteriaceae bacterium]